MLASGFNCEMQPKGNKYDRDSWTVKGYYCTWCPSGQKVLENPHTPGTLLTRAHISTSLILQSRVKWCKVGAKTPSVSQHSFQTSVASLPQEGGFN